MVGGIHECDVVALHGCNSVVVQNGWDDKQNEEGHLCSDAHGVIECLPTVYDCTFLGWVDDHSAVDLIFFRDVKSKGKVIE